MGLIEKFASWFIGKEPIPVPVVMGRNEQCHCGSGLKYKRCCLGTDKIKLSKQAACCRTSS